MTGAPRVHVACRCCGQVFEQETARKICPDCGRGSAELEREGRQWALGCDAAIRACGALERIAEDPSGPFARGFRGMARSLGSRRLAR